MPDATAFCCCSRAALRQSLCRSVSSARHPAESVNCVGRECCVRQCMHFFFMLHFVATCTSSIDALMSGGQGLDASPPPPPNTACLSLFDFLKISPRREERATPLGLAWCPDSKRATATSPPFLWGSSFRVPCPSSSERERVGPGLSQRDGSTLFTHSPVVCRSLLTHPVPRNTLLLPPPRCRRSERRLRHCHSANPPGIFAAE